MGPQVESIAARVLSAAAGGLPADEALRRQLRGSRLPAATRAAVSRAVFAYFRWLGWIEERRPAQAVRQAWELQDRFDKTPAFFKDAALAARAVPPWLASEMEVSPAFLRSLQSPAPLYLRPRAADAAAVAAALGAAPVVLPAGLAVPGLVALRHTSAQDLHATPAFQEGRFEIQDLASQLVGHACAPGAGEIWWDACAGEGGKTLHLCDLLGGKGLVWASDRSHRRLDVLRERAARAKVFNARVCPWRGTSAAPMKTLFDGVLVDAPCSGVGTWRRNPHARWTTGPADVAELAEVQARLLALAAGRVKPGGRLVYSVCTLTRSETTAVADRFEAEHAGFTPEPVGFSGQARTVLDPAALQANGMFIARWRRS
jgi:16S rRNA (cytosine967-C5)-methyltransferase